MGWLGSPKRAGWREKKGECIGKGPASQTEYLHTLTINVYQCLQHELYNYARTHTHAGHRRDYTDNSIHTLWQ